MAYSEIRRDKPQLHEPHPKSKLVRAKVEITRRGKVIETFLPKKKGGRRGK